MIFAQKVKEICKEMNVTIADISRMIGQSQQNLGKKINNGTLGYDDFIKILDVLGVKFDYKCILPGTEEVENNIKAKVYDEKIRLIEAELDYEKQKNEFYDNLFHEFRSAFFTFNGNVEQAIKYVNEANKSKVYLERMKKVNDDIIKMLNEYNNLNKFASSRDSVASSYEGIKPINIQGKTILLVEDNKMNRDITKEILEENGVKVIEARDGVEAVEICRGNLNIFDAILMDIQMPIKDGNQATKEIRAFNNPKANSIPIIAMTANAYEEDQKTAFDSGMNAYLSKPLDNKKLMQVLSYYLNSKK